MTMNNKIKANRNIAILAHVDAGKTTVSERILFASREINACGEVDEGLATMDYLADEKEKGITIETGIHSYKWKSNCFSFLDTPGHIDFSAEVDQSLDAADIGVVVVSGVRGIEVRTVISWNLLATHKVPYMFFINKLDMAGVDLDLLLVDLEERCGRPLLYMSYPWFDNGELAGSIDILNNCLLVKDDFNKETKVLEIPEDWVSTRNSFYKDIIEAAADLDDEIAEKYFAGVEVSSAKIISVLTKAYNQEKFALVYMGSAIKNIGIRQLATAIHLFGEVREKSYPDELGKIIQFRLPTKGEGFYVFKSFCDGSILDFNNLPKGLSFYKIKAEQLSFTDKIEFNSLYALRQEVIDIQSHDAFRTGDVIDINGTVVRNVWNGVYQPLIQTRIEADSVDDIALLTKILARADLADPALKIEYSEAGGNWILHTVGEVHRDVWIKRLERDYKCSFCIGSPESVRYERINKDILDFSITAQSEVFKASMKVDFIQSLEEAPKPIFECDLDDLTKEVLLDAVDQGNRNGIAGVGTIINTQLVVKSFDLQTRMLPGLVKKMVLDAYNLALKPANMDVLSPLVELQISVPQDFCGKIISDLESRNAKILNLDSDGHLTKIKVEVFLDEIFGYSTDLRSISMGSASYTMIYLRHEKELIK